MTPASPKRGVSQTASVPQATGESPATGTTASSEAVIGFNTNVPYRRAVYHIQTEDTGSQRAHIDTHLFCNGGQIVKSLRFDYSKYRDREGLRILVNRAMKAQHRAMHRLLTSGELDELLDDAPGSRRRVSSLPPSLNASTSEPPKPAVHAWEAAITSVRAVWEQKSPEVRESRDSDELPSSALWERAINSVRQSWTSEAEDNEPESLEAPLPLPARLPTLDNLPTAPDNLPNADNCFDAGLDALRRGDRESALSQWSLAVHLQPANRKFRTNLLKLLARWDSE